MSSRGSKPQVAALAINANDEPSRFASFGLPIIADRIVGHAGPLAGLHAALPGRRRAAQTSAHVVMVACDTPFLPDDLVERFLAALEETGRECCVARSGEGVHPVIGLWPPTIAGKLETALDQGQRKAEPWAEQQRAVEVFFPPAQIGGGPIDPFFNINRPGGSRRSQRAARPAGQAQGLMRLIFEPSSVRLYIRPFWSRMKPITGLTTLSVSIEPPTPTVMIATEPSTPIFHPALSSNPRKASWVMNMMMTERSCTPS